MNRMTGNDILEIFKFIEVEMRENSSHLIHLDSFGGDGDLGISMCQGFRGIIEELSNLDLSDMELKDVFLKAAMAINEYSPSSLGTILCAGMIGGAKMIGTESESFSVRYRNFVAGALDGIMQRAGSKRGEKTILDAIGGALDALEKSIASGDSPEDAVQAASSGARDGMEATKDMIAVHGRAAYRKENSRGYVDGGATVGMLIFKAVSEYVVGN